MILAKGQLRYVITWTQSKSLRGLAHVTRCLPTAHNNSNQCRRTHVGRVCQGCSLNFDAPHVPQTNLKPGLGSLARKAQRRRGPTNCTANLAVAVRHRHLHPLPTEQESSHVGWKGMTSVAAYMGRGDDVWWGCGFHEGGEKRVNGWVVRHPIG
jgi:hypothetical protein